MRRHLLIPMLALLIGASGAHAATAPAQPKAGLPGGADNPDATVVRKAVGQASAATFVFHLAGAPAQPRPVVVLLHAWGAVNPSVYGGWIDHLARRGYLVLFPAFQEVGRTRPVEASAAAATLVRDALAALAGDAEAKPDPGKLAYLGHSAGAGIALNLAAEAKNGTLPSAKLVFAMMPGGIASDAASRGIVLLELAAVPPTTAVVTMVGDREFQASERVSRRFLRETAGVPQSQKLFMRAFSDDHGFPALSATLASPASPKEGYDSAAIKVQPDPPLDRKAPRPQRPRWSADMVLSGEQTVLVQQLGRNTTDTLDYFAFWRTFDMAADAAFAGTEMAVLKTDPNLVDMLRWSDGWPVRRLYVETPKAVDPNATATTAPKAAPASAKQPVTRQRRQPAR